MRRRRALLLIDYATPSRGARAKARRGEIKNFTGIDSDYEAPERAEITLDTSRVSAAEAATHIVEHLKKSGYLG